MAEDAAARLDALQLCSRAVSWANSCGAISKKESAGSSYEQYLDGADIQEAAADLKQIKKDVESGRTDAKCFGDELMRLACADVTREQLTRLDNSTSSSACVVS